MTQTRSIWMACVTIGVLLMLLAAGRAEALAAKATSTTVPGPQAAWTWLNPLPQGNGLMTISAVDDIIVTAGATQAVYQSANAGTAWQAADVDTNQTIPSVILDPESDGQNGWMVAQSDLGSTFEASLYQTTDSGVSWSKLSDFPADTPISTLTAVDSQTLYAGGENGYVGVSTDGGATWNDVSIPMGSEYSTYVAGLSFVDADRGYAATARILYGTEDGGENWSVVKEFEKDANDPYKPRMNCVAATLIEGDESDQINLYVTTNQDGAWQSLGGDDWTQCPTDGETATYHVAFLGASYGVITGTSGKVWVTDDGGVSWDGSTLPLEYNVYDAAWKEDGELLACGAGGLLARSRDGGMTWNRIGQGFPWTLYATAFKDQDTGWTVGEAGFIAATTNGSTWRTLRAAKSNRATLEDVAFSTYKRGCAVGENGTILTTKNAGSTWKTRRSATVADLSGVAFFGRQDGWVVGTRKTKTTTWGVIRHTTDGGVHWRGQKIPSGVKTLTKVRFVDNRIGWAVGTPGIVLRTTNGGKTWKKVALANKAILLDVEFVDRKYGWVCGTIGLGGDIGYRTTNGGRTWTRETIPADASYAVDFTDRRHGWQVGEFGNVIATTDGGATWTLLPASSPSSTLLGVRMWGDGTGYIVGQCGTIMKTDTGGEGAKK